MQQCFAFSAAQPGRYTLDFVFGQPWSPEVHRILARACESAGVRPVRVGGCLDVVHRVDADGVHSQQPNSVVAPHPPG